MGKTKTRTESTTEKPRTTRKPEVPARAGEQVIVRPQMIASTGEQKVDTHIQEEHETRMTLLAVVKACVDSIETMVSKSSTTSVVTLKYPPMFEGAILTVTEPALARNEFNINFANISPDARRLIESVANQEELRQTLAVKGYTVHMVTIEAVPKPISTARTETQPDTGSKEGGEQKREARTDQGRMDLV